MRNRGQLQNKLEQTQHQQKGNSTATKGIQKAKNIQNTTRSDGANDAAIITYSIGCEMSQEYVVFPFMFKLQYRKTRNINITACQPIKRRKQNTVHQPKNTGTSPRGAQALQLTRDKIRPRYPHGDCRRESLLGQSGFPMTMVERYNNLTHLLFNLSTGL